jgi:Uma2 family endonuclease
MSLPKRVPYISVEEYLVGEEASEVRHEYVAGQIFAMSGATEAHNLIAGNVYALLRAHLRGSGCWAFIENLKLRVEAADTFYYPDVFVTCGPLDGKSVFKQHAHLIVEVLSSSTENIDRREKLLNYRLLDNLQEYVLVAQKRRQVEIYRRDEQGRWQLEIIAPDGELHLKSLPNGPLTLTMDEIYEDVIFRSVPHPLT